MGQGENDTPKGSAILTRHLSVAGLLKETFANVLRICRVFPGRKLTSSLDHENDMINERSRLLPDASTGSTHLGPGGLFSSSQNLQASSDSTTQGDIGFQYSTDLVKAETNCCWMVLIPNGQEEIIQHLLHAAWRNRAYKTLVDNLTRRSR